MEDRNQWKCYTARTPFDYSLKPHQAEMLDEMCESEVRHTPFFSMPEDDFFEEMREFCGVQIHRRSELLPEKETIKRETKKMILARSNNGWCGASDTARYFGTNVNLIAYWRKNGKLPERAIYLQSKKIAKKYLYHLETIDICTDLGRRQEETE